MKRSRWLRAILISLTTILLVVAGLYWRIFIQPVVPLQQEGQPAPDHSLWDAQLQKYVSSYGGVNYVAWKEDRAPLEDYLQLLADATPSESWTREEQLAYWINAYNAFTVALILDHYPIGSIEELHTIPLIGTIFHDEWFSLGGESMSLNRIEHGVLRRQFEEPRIHAAINCASISCPTLWNRAYTAASIDEQLDRAMRSFVNDPVRNRIRAEEVAVSAIFSWFRFDFTKEGSLVDYLNQYLEVPLRAEADVSYLTYDWRLNEIQNMPF